MPVIEIDDLKKQVDDLKVELKKITDDVAREISNQKIKAYQTSVRLESLIRFHVERHGVSFDDYIDFVDSYIKFTASMDELMKSDTLAGRVKAAAEFNENALVKIYADDLNVLPIIAQTGGISNILKTQLFALPHTNRFEKELAKLINEEEAAVPAN